MSLFDFEFGRAHPLAKLSIWGCSTVIVIGAIQTICWVAGVEYNGFADDNLRLITILGTLLIIMHIDQRPISDIGLNFFPGWKKKYILSFLFSGFLLIIYISIAIFFGLITVNIEHSNWARALEAPFSALTAIPLAAVQQLMVSGYLVATLRDRYSSLAAVAAASALFVLIEQGDNFTSLSEPHFYASLAMVFFAVSLLAILRLITGSIVMPAAAMAGWIFVSRFADKLHIFTVADGAIDGWMAMNGDIRRAPLIIGLLALGNVVAAMVLRSRGVAQAPADSLVVDEQFKRVAPFTVFLQFAPLDIWLRRLIDERFRLGSPYYVRFASILLLSSVYTVVSLPERILTSFLIRFRPRPSPVFILGMQRSGTTHLHRLLALDERYYAPRVHQVINPAGHLLSGWLMLPITALFVPGRRPMDSVSFGLFAAEEEEFSVAGISGFSPYWRFVFPQSAGKYEKYARIDSCDKADIAGWERAYLHVVKMLGFWHPSRTLLLKNPENTGRVAALHRLFPHAKFIHICRHPYEAYQSNRHLDREAIVLYQLQDPISGDGYSDRFLENYRAMETAFANDAALLPAGSVTSVRFEDLENDPLPEIERIYSDLGIDLTVGFRSRLLNYLAGLSDYRKNVHRPLSEVERSQVRSTMGGFMEDWGYRNSDS